MVVEELAGAVVNGHVNCPGGNVAEDHGFDAAIETLDAFLTIYYFCGASEALVELWRTLVFGNFMIGLRLVLELRLDHIERAGRDSADDAGHTAGEGVDAGGSEVVGSPYREIGETLGDY